MAIPALLKSPYVLGSVCVVGVGGISLVSLSGGGDGIDYSKAVNSREQIKAREGVVKHLMTGDWLKNDKCFSEFFPNSKVSLKTNLLYIIKDPFTVQAPTISDSSSTSACAFIQYSYLKKEAFIFQMEITVKNENVGLALWVAGRNVGGALYHDDKLNPENSNNVRYYLAFMEKTEGDLWVTKGGYSWYDSQFSYASDKKTLNVNIAGNPMYPHKEFSGIKSAIPYKDKEWTHDFYFGRWNESVSSGQEVFEGIELWRDNKGSAEMLGRDYFKTFEETKGAKGYSDETGFSISKYEYVKPKDNQLNANASEGWHPRQTISVAALDNWYKPFRGKKGTWVKTALETDTLR